VGDRAWRAVWRETNDNTGALIEVMSTPQAADQLWPQVACDGGSELLLAVGLGKTLGWSNGLDDGVGDGGSVGVLVTLIDGLGLLEGEPELVGGSVLGEEGVALGAGELGVAVGEGVFPVADGESDVVAGVGWHGWLTEGVALTLGVDGSELGLLAGGGVETCDAGGRTFAEIAGGTPGFTGGRGALRMGVGGAGSAMIGVPA
jgi:hypothetical protein